VKVTGKRSDNGDEMSVTWTLEMAERAGLLNKQNWKKYPEAMLWARAASQLCRMLFADCFAGATYTPEEIGADEITGDELLHEPPVAAPSQIELETEPEEPVAVDADVEQTIADLTGQLLAVATDENREKIEAAIARNKVSHWSEPAKHVAWLQGQLDRVGAAA